MSRIRVRGSIRLEQPLCLGREFSQAGLHFRKTFLHGHESCCAIYIQKELKEQHCGGFLTFLDYEFMPDKDKIGGFPSAKLQQVWPRVFGQVGQSSRGMTVMTVLRVLSNPPSPN